MRKVASGQKLSISASTFNSMLDASADFKRRTHNRGSRSVPPDTRNGIVLIRNQSGADCDRFSVLGISGVLVTSLDNEQEFASRFALNGATPAAEHEGKFAILLEPIANAAFGKAMISGVTPALVQGDSAAGSKTAGIQAGQTYLVPNAPGAQILYEETTSGVELHLALVRIPSGGGGTGNVSVAAATTANIAITGTQTIDGVSATVGTVVLVKNQSVASQNGIYKAAAGAWTREGSLTSGMLVSVRGGTANGQTVWMLTNADPIVAGVTALTYRGTGAFYG